MSKRARWYRPRGLVALVAAFSSLGWAAMVMTDDFEVSRRAEMLRSTDSRERYSALLDLSVVVASESRHARPAIPLVLRATGDNDPRVRAQAIITLSDLAGSARSLHLDPSVYALARRITIEHLDDPSPEVRAAAIGSLGRLGPLESSAFPLLVRMTRQPELMLTRASALMQLGRYDSSNRGARLAVLDATDDAEPYVRASAAGSLGTWVSSDGQVALTTLALLDDPDQRVRYAAYEALRALAEPQPELLPALEKMLADDDVIKAQVAAELIGRMGDKAQGLSRQLWDAHRRFRPDKATSVFVETLALVAPHSEESTTAIRSLLTAIGTGQHRTQIQAARALGSFGSGAVSAVPELERAAQSTDRAVRQAALDALQQIHEKPATDSGKNVPPV